MDQAKRNGEQNFGDNQDFMPTRVFGRWARDAFVPDAERGEELVEQDVTLSLGIQDFSPREDSQEHADEEPSGAEDPYIILGIDDAEFYLPPAAAAALGEKLVRLAEAEGIV